MFEQSGVEGLTSFDMGGSSSLLSIEQAEALKALGRVDASALDAAPRRLDRQRIRPPLRKPLGADRAAAPPGARISQTRSHLAQRPDQIRGDEKTQKAFVASYENTLNSIGEDEVAVFVDAVHPTHAARPVGWWAPKQQNLAIEPETGQIRMMEADAIDAMSTIRLLESLELLHPLIVCIHVFLDNARGHHAKLVSEWLSRPGCRI